MKEEVKNEPALRFPEFTGVWPMMKVRDFATVSAGATPTSTKVEYWDGDIRWMNSGELNLKRVYEVENRITELGLRSSSTKLLPKYCVLIGLAGQGKTRGTVGMNMVELCTNQSIAAIHPNCDKYDSNYLYHNLDFRYLELRGLSTGDGGRGGLNLQIIKSLDVSLPSLPEQQKIASFLTAVDDKIQQLSKKKTLLEQYKKGVMQQLFSQKLRFKDDQGNAFPDWEEKKLGDMVKLQGGFAFKSELFSTEGIPVIRISNISNDNNYIDLSNLVYYHEFPKSDNFQIKTGDLILAMSGATTGKSSIYNLPGTAYLNQRVGLFKSLTPDLHYPFLVQFVFSIQFQKQMRSVLVAGAQPNVSSSDIEGFVFPCPSIEEQTKIANFLTAIDDKINSVNQQIEHTRQFKKGLLQQMFV